MRQDEFEFMTIPVFSVQKATQTRNWHAVRSAKDVLEQRELALYHYMESRAMTGANHGSAKLWGEVTVSHEVLGATLLLRKIGLQRSLRRLTTLCFIEVIKQGRARGKATTYRVYSQSSVDDIVRLSGCTHYCKQGGARKLYRAARVDNAIAG
jgi:hypothetical protein